MGKFRPLPEPIRLQDLLNSARSRTEKKINGIIDFAVTGNITGKTEVFQKIAAGTRSYSFLGQVRIVHQLFHTTVARDTTTARGTPCINPTYFTGSH